jgi:hypothetical protein
VNVGDIVEISTEDGTAEAIVTRVWDKPASDPYVTVKTTEDHGRTFVRYTSHVRPVTTPEPTIHEQAVEAAASMWRAAFGRDPF